ncbi:crotonase/enoyl-CoA hydratase family protein [Frankia sp. CNm7]|uniref:Crotonase/enoyl-CoA hydratase family protein n=1 Tax=Frankia nepalensis TaxID=1836974 RepID=A0A937RA68_9ACTN|nr:crotonase/enoyl-CoA hydratase family protein [Frankia nepalensis]MBL7495406.1 crotonase/enoyl-CoA hydratase family protein [Frankia nepalensis]MBL7514838.1 crotonase/enoyl-CoA hydratase family protein [Frankia nepalensis]MBL7519846.1 crotonase/enoyl-CoA hydratase family protein [Frankia nepalensis]MBL7625962.1 crotonase/enoyl-CoA hydratase family protein [Frankia nepalensis]
MTTTGERETDTPAAGLAGELVAYPTAAALTSLRVERRSADGSVVQVTLLGPGKGNAMGPDFFRELPEVFAALDADDSVRAVVVTGSGRNFSYGLDLTSMLGDIGSTGAADGGLAAARTALLGKIRRLQRSVDAVADCRKPVAAAISGWCVGGGVDLAAACDVRYASADARFSVREVRVAIVADLGSLQRLPAIIGDGHLRELALTGRDIDAARAERIGLVGDVLPDPAAALAAAHAFADEAAANPPLVVQGIKEILDVARGPEVAAGLRYVAAWNAAFLPSHDLAEAVTAFTERRPPRYQGR